MAHLKGDENPMLNYDWGRVCPIHPPHVGDTPTHEKVVQGVFLSGAHTQLTMDSGMVPQGVFPFGTQAQPMMGSGTMPQGALQSRTQTQSMMSSGFQRKIQFSAFFTMAENMQVDSFQQRAEQLPKKEADEKRQRAEKLAEKQAEDECSGPKRHVCKGNPNVARGSIDEDRFRCLSWFQKSSDLICTIGKKEIPLHTEGTLDFFHALRRLQPYVSEEFQNLFHGSSYSSSFSYFA